MHKRILTAGAVFGALMLPLAANAQSSGVAAGATREAARKRQLRGFRHQIGNVTGVS